MPSYAFRDASGDLVLSAPEFEKPIPVHAQQASAVAAVEAMKAQAARERAERDDIVADHGHPRWIPYDGPVETASARRLRRLAEAAGFEVRQYEDAERCTVEGHHPERRQGFRASWLRGKADFGSWHAPYKTMTVKDERPIGINKLTRTALKGHRGAGSGDVRTIIVSSPGGIEVGVTEVERRVKEIDG